jgi:DNA-binding beta-propeller fold protein YncE
VLPSALRAGLSGTGGRVAVVSVLGALMLAACGSSHHSSTSSNGNQTTTASPPVTGLTVPTGSSAPSSQPAADGPSSTGTPTNVYSADMAGDLSPVVRGDPALVYVPNSLSGTVDVISQRTMKIVREFPTGDLPQHVTPSYDLRTLYVDNDLGNTLTPIDPRTGRPAGRQIPVEDPYNLYFTPDGRFAIVVAERLQLLDFRNAHTMRLVHSLSVPDCRGVDHMDFSADGRYAIASCEFAGRMIKVDLHSQQVVGTLVLNKGSSAPQDVKLSPDGRTIYTADQESGGLWEINPSSLRVIGFLKTGAGAHGLYPSRDAKVMYVSNRQAGSISVVSFRTRRVIKTWQLPLPASPDMGGVSADGLTLWLSGRYNAVVYAINTRTGQLRAAIPVGQGPHGLCVWPQPGRYSLGHTGILR